MLCQRRGWFLNVCELCLLFVAADTMNGSSVYLQDYWRRQYEVARRISSSLMAFLVSLTRCMSLKTRWVAGCESMQECTATWLAQVERTLK
jgi:hypothetical protein